MKSAILMFVLFALPLQMGLSLFMIKSHLGLGGQNGLDTIFYHTKRRESAFACLRNAETVVSGDARARQPGGAWLAGMAAG